MRGWLTPPPEAAFDDPGQALGGVYPPAPERAQPGERTGSIEGMTGIQARERAAAPLPRPPGPVERQEVESIRHRTQALIASVEVATGPGLGGVGATRTEADVAQLLKTRVATDPLCPKWHRVMANRNTQVAAAVVRWGAEHSAVTAAVGGKGQARRLPSMAAREACRREDSPRLGVPFTPNQASWLNPIERWFSLLVRPVIRRGTCLSREALRHKRETFIDEFNRTMAKPFRWPYQGTPLTA